jgi:DNA-directed RNA polymerase subunit M/transcription elongation factor TFIIS
MHFCSNCKNMYYIKLSDTDNNELVYYCRNCGNNDKLLHSENICVSKVKLNHNSQKMNLFINNFTKLDPTLPRSNTIKCPHEECITNTKDYDDANREVIFIRYDDVNMKYIYLCCKCDFTWKTNIN